MVAHDLNISPHKTVVLYPEGQELIFVFSSDLYRRKFEERLWENRDSINKSLTNRFGFQIRNDRVADLKLYTLIEKRGFLIYYNEVKITCLNKIEIVGNLLTYHGI